ncbi:magnesium transporter [Lihuaxuella thermophila]|uniref:Magnesium transporter MgtE n=1 Tax=Lihuaxuella thermophila TaxID=1173111 RepID=A0A1H8AL88_9BACL|nr:magnesium transporter [Lihuaxuella thermophila]SEM71401.1 magnesium transporter [Lihuaxuella thermophila]
MEETGKKREIERLVRYLQTRDDNALRAFIDELQPYDLGEIFFELNGIHRRRFLTVLQPEEIALLLEELEPSEQKEVIEALGPAKTASVLNLMSSDDAADLLGKLDDPEAQHLLRDMQREEAERVRDLLRYPEDTAGGLMTHEYVSVYNHFTAEEAISHLRKEAPSAETIYYVYVTDKARHLVGVVSLRDLLIAPPATYIRDIMYERVISAPVDMDQEQVAALLVRYDFLAIPVVDAENRLLGIITVDDIIDVLIEEAQEDISNLSAAGPTDKGAFVPPLRSAGRRIPWLLLLLLIGMMTANLLGLFQKTIELLPVLTVFMPMIAGMTGNTATQSLAIIIRALANNQLGRTNYRKVIRQEGTVGIIIGIFCSTLIIVMVALWKQSVALGVVVGLSLFCTLLIGTLVGTLIPLLLNKLNIDPTVASGPLITTLNDVISLMVYFGLATFFIHQLL